MSSKKLVNDDESPSEPDSEGRTLKTDKNASMSAKAACVEDRRKEQGGAQAQPSK